MCLLLTVPNTHDQCPHAILDDSDIPEPSIPIQDHRTHIHFFRLSTAENSHPPTNPQQNQLVFDAFVEDPSHNETLRNALLAHLEQRVREHLHQFVYYQPARTEEVDGSVHVEERRDADEEDEEEAVLGVAEVLGDRELNRVRYIRVAFEEVVRNGAVG